MDPRFQGQPAPVPQPPVKRWAFRWTYIWILLAIAVTAWFINRVHAAVSWEAVMNALNVKNEERYTRLFVLGLTLTGFCAIYRVMRTNKK